jgi:hypothetical protein
MNVNFNNRLNMNYPLNNNGISNNIRQNPMMNIQNQQNNFPSQNQGFNQNNRGAFNKNIVPVSQQNILLQNNQNFSNFNNFNQKRPSVPHNWN